MPDLTSAANPRVKAVAALRDRRARDRARLTIVDGAREVRRALESGLDVREVFVHEPSLAGPDARAALDAMAHRRLTPVTTSAAAFARLAFGDRTEGIVAVVAPPSIELASLELPSEPLLVVLEGVEKPGNLGAVLRSADGAGGDAVIAADPRTDLWNPNTIRASAGTIFGLRLAAAATPDVILWLADQAVRVVAARVDAPTLYTDVDLRGPLAIALGSEADGLTAAWREADVAAVRLPMLGRADSLNVSVTAAVLLYEARRQRGLPAGRSGV